MTTATKIRTKAYKPHRRVQLTLTVKQAKALEKWAVHTMMTHSLGDGLDGMTQEQYNHLSNAVDKLDQAIRLTP